MLAQLTALFGLSATPSQNGTPRGSMPGEDFASVFGEMGPESGDPGIDLTLRDSQNGAQVEKASEAEVDDALASDQTDTDAMVQCRSDGDGADDTAFAGDYTEADADESRSAGSAIAVDPVGWTAKPASVALSNPDVLPSTGQIKTGHPGGHRFDGSAVPGGTAKASQTLTASNLDKQHAAESVGHKHGQPIGAASDLSSPGDNRAAWVSTNGTPRIRQVTANGGSEASSVFDRATDAPHDISLRRSSSWAIQARGIATAADEGRQSPSAELSEGSARRDVYRDDRGARLVHPTQSGDGSGEATGSRDPRLLPIFGNAPTGLEVRHGVRALASGLGATLGKGDAAELAATPAFRAGHSTIPGQQMHDARGGSGVGISTIPVPAATGIPQTALETRTGKEPRAAQAAIPQGMNSLKLGAVRTGGDAVPQNVRAEKAEYALSGGRAAEAAMRAGSDAPASKNAGGASSWIRVANEGLAAGALSSSADDLQPLKIGAFAGTELKATANESLLGATAEGTTGLHPKDKDQPNKGVPALQGNDRFSKTGEGEVFPSEVGDRADVRRTSSGGGAAAPLTGPSPQLSGASEKLAESLPEQTLRKTAESGDNAGGRPTAVNAALSEANFQTQERSATAARADREALINAWSRNDGLSSPPAALDRALQPEIAPGDKASDLPIKMLQGDRPSRRDRSEVILERQGVVPTPTAQAPRDIPLPLQITQRPSVISPVLFDIEEETADEGALLQAPAEARGGSAAPSASVHHPSPAHRPDPQQVLKQVSDTLAKASDGSLEVRLSPEELGRVRFQILSGEHGVTIQVGADRPETLDLMRRHADQLARDFAEAGYENATFDFGGGSGSGRDERQGSAPSDSAQESVEARNSEPPATTGPDGLDIRI